MGRQVAVAVRTCSDLEDVLLRLFPQIQDELHAGRHCRKSAVQARAQKRHQLSAAFLRFEKSSRQGCSQCDGADVRAGIPLSSTAYQAVRQDMPNFRIAHGPSALHPPFARSLVFRSAVPRFVTVCDRCPAHAFEAMRRTLLLLALTFALGTACAAQASFGLTR
jgi:hypothetical protein